MTHRAHHNYRRTVAAAAALMLIGALVLLVATATPARTQAPDTASAVWPDASSDVRYDDPVEAARGFAAGFLGMEDADAGEFMAGDSRSGEVEIGRSESRRLTTVFVRQLGPDDSWWVLGSASADVVVDEPDALDEVTSPVAVSGRSRAFEANVPVEVRQDGSTDPIGSGYVMGGAMAELEPFSGEIRFSEPTAPAGALVFIVPDMRDGGVDSASVVRIRFAEPDATTTTTAAAPASSTTTPTTEPPTPVPADPHYTG